MTGAVAAAARRLRQHVAARGEWWWAPVLYAIAVAWIHRDLWHQNGHPTGLGWDVIDTYGPDLEFQAGELRDGALSSWNPYDRGGYAAVADPQFDRYYPGSWPFVAFGAAAGVPWWLIQLKMLLHQVIAASMLHLYLRSRGLPRSAGVIGGMALIASVPMLIHKASLVFIPLVWVPLAWIAVDRLTEAPSWRRGLAVAGAGTLIVTAGSPPGWFYAALMIGIYAVFRLATQARTRRTELARYARQLAGPTALALIALGLVAAVVIVPFRELLPLTARNSGPGFALGGPLEPAETLAGMIAPSHGMVHAYLGLVATALALCGAVLGWRHDRRVAILWFVLGAVAMSLTFGDRWPILPWLVDHVPGFDRLRAPTRYRLITAWTFAALAALGWATLCGACGALTRRQRRTAVAIAAVVVLGTVLVVALRVPSRLPPMSRTGAMSIAFALTAAAVVVLAAWLPRRWLPGLAVVIPIVIVNDPRYFTFTPGVKPPAERRVPARADETEILASLGDVSERWRVWDEFVLCHRVGPRRRVRDLRGYPAGDPISQSRFNDVLAKAKAAPRILEAFNVKWILSGPHPRDGTSLNFVKQPTADGHFVKRDKIRFEALHPAPLVAWYGAIHVAPAGKVLDAMLAAEEADGSRRLAIVEPADAARLGPARSALEAAASGPPPVAVAGELVAYEPDRIVVTVAAPAPGMVVLDEVMYPGWEVAVDGAGATAVRVNYLLRGVAVGPGRHTIEWTFRPTHHRLLVAGYLLALVAIIAAWPPWRRLVARVRRYARR